MTGVQGRARSSLNGEKVGSGLNYFFTTILVIACVYPFLNVIAYSLSSGRAILSGWVTFLPREFQLDAYKAVLMKKSIWDSMGITIFVTFTATLMGLFLTTLSAYSLSKKRLKGRYFISILFLFTMYFSGGIIPTFIVVKNLGLINRLGALILPNAFSVFNFIVMRTFFQQLPEELEEAAILDGCNDLVVLVRIMLPLSMPIMATIGLFYAVGHWNEYFNSMMYINDPSKFTLQLKLRQLLFTEELAQMSGNFDLVDGNNTSMPESLKAASIVISTIPIIVVYPWLQKYFVKGVMIGSIKG